MNGISVNHCLIINLDTRPELWNNLEDFRTEWVKNNKTVERIPGVNYKNKNNVVNELIQSNRLNLNGSGFRNNKNAFMGELGCYMSHYNCWKHIVNNKLKSCLILEDGVTITKEKINYQNLSINSDILYVNEEMKTDYQKNFIGYGMQGYIVTQKGAKQLLTSCHTLSAPIDLQIRHLCNTKELIGDTLLQPFVKRDNNRISSISDKQSLDDNNLDDKQNEFPLIQRILINLLKKNINIDDLI